MSGQRVSQPTGAREAIDPELERRIAALESGPDAGSDFDFMSWVWLILFGILGPAALLLWAWFG